MAHPLRGKFLSEIKIEMLLRQYRMMATDKPNWSELGRRCGVHASTAKKYVEEHLKLKDKG